MELEVLRASCQPAAPLTQREGTLPGKGACLAQQELLSAKIGRSLLLPAGISACGMPLRASKEFPQGLALSLEHLESSLGPPGRFTALSCRLCTLPWLLPLSQRECQPGAALTTGVAEGTGAPPLPKAGAVGHCWGWVFHWDAQHGRGWARDKCQGVPARPGDLVQALPQHVPCPGCCGHGHAQTQHSLQLLWLPVGTSPRQHFNLLDSKQPLACCTAPGKLSAPPSLQPHPSSGGNGKDHQ